MGKDRTGKFIPLKGKPSGNGKESELGLRPDMGPDDLERDQEMTQKYTSDDQELAPNVRMRHPNRNVAKGEEEEFAEQDKGKNTYKKRYDTPVENPATTIALPTDLTKDDLVMLAAHSADCCITLCIPTHRAGMEVNEKQDMILFKNMLQDLEQELLKKGMSINEVETMLQPAFSLIRDDDFWNWQLNSLVIFIAPGFFKYLKLPYQVGEQQYISSAFDVSALLPMLTNKEQFFVLTLGRRKVVLYEADIWGMREVMVKELAMGIDDMVRSGEKIDQQESTNEDGSTDFHGTGAGKPTDRTNVSMYMDEVDDELWNEVLSMQHVPLLLAGVEDLFAFYKQRSKYQHIADATLPGNFEDNIHGLYENAKEILRPYLEKRLQKGLQRYYNSIASNLTSSMPGDVIPACYYSRAELLFLQKGYQLWGTFDEMDNKLVLHDAPEEGDEDLAHKAAVKAYLNAAEVFMLDKEQMPNGAEIAALMRY